MHGELAKVGGSSANGWPARMLSRSTAAAARWELVDVGAEPGFARQTYFPLCEYARKYS